MLIKEVGRRSGSARHISEMARKKRRDREEEIDLAFDPSNHPFIDILSRSLHSRQRYYFPFFCLTFTERTKSEGGKCRWEEGEKRKMSGNRKRGNPFISCSSDQENDWRADDGNWHSPTNTILITANTSERQKPTRERKILHYTGAAKKKRKPSASSFVRGARMRLDH